MKDYGLLLKSERQAQGLTQERAAELAGISVDSWYIYEAGKALPSEETAISICDALDADWLLREYVESKYLAFGLWGDRINPESLEQASISWATALHQAAQELPRLLQIVADGRVDLSEQEDYDGIRPTCLRLAELGLWMAYPRIKIKKDRPDVGTSRRFVPRPKSKNDREIILAHRSENVNTFPRRGGASL